MATPLRVALDARDLAAPAARGMVRYVVELARRLTDHGVRPTLFHRAREPLHPGHIAGLPCAVVGLPDRGGVWWEQVSVPRALARGGFHIYHAPCERGVPLFAPCPVVRTLHSATAASYADLVRRRLLPGPVSRYLGYDPARHRFRFSALYGRLQGRRPDHTITVSEFSRGELVRLLGFAPARVSVTPLAAPSEFAATPPDPDRARTVLHRLGVRPPYLLFVGGFEAHKNPAGLFPVLARLRRQIPALSLVLVGTGGVPGALVSAPPGTVFLSDLTDELPDLYDSALAFVSLSWRESFGVPYLEALSRGCPVVASRWGAALEVVGLAGRLVDPRDPDAAAAAVLSPPVPKAVALRQAARFSWDRTARLTADLYRRLAHHRIPERVVRSNGAMMSAPVDVRWIWSAK